MPGTDTRHIITSSEDANPPPPTRQISQDGTEIIPTRILKVSTPKPASNPLQFIKTGPCDLYKAAQEQIKKVEEIKKVEKVKDDSEDWQSNLDNWKCSRRKRQEHIIERVVEVKKLEMAEHDRNRRRSKTFSEMMEERNSKGGLRKMSMLSYSEDDSNDLSDLGISSKEKSSGDFTSDQVQNGSSNYQSSGNGLKPSNGHGSSHYDEESSSTPVTISSPEPEEYTFERAIQGYMNFAEAKVKTPVKTPVEKKEVNGSINFKIGSMKKEPSGKIGEKLSELEQIRLYNKSTKDVNGGTEAKQLPKVDINKRRSLFEKAESKDEKVVVKSNDSFPKDFSSSKSIKERLSNLEKPNENPTEETHAPVEVAPNIKETIGCLEKQRSVEMTSGKRPSNGDISSQISVKERLNSLKQSDGEGQVKSRGSPSEDIRPVPLKERMSSFDGSSSKDAFVKLTPERDSWFKEKLESFKLTEKNYNDNGNIITDSSLNICSDNKPNEVSVNRLNVEDFKNESKELPPSSDTSQNLEDVRETKLTEKLEEKLCKQNAEDLLSVSSYAAETKATPDDLVVLDDVEGCGDGVETKQKEKADEMERNNEVVEIGEGCTDNTNIKVEGSENKAVTDSGEGAGLGLSLDENTCKPPQSTQLTHTACDLSDTIVTCISLPDTSTLCPRVNISLSYDSISKDISTSEDEEALDEFPEDHHHHRSNPYRNSVLTNKPKARVRKLTPISTPPISISPLKTVCELQIIEEGETGEQIEDEAKVEKGIAVHMTSERSRGNMYGSDSEVQEMVKEDGEPEGEDDQENSPMYTDENIDEVLGKEDEVETCVDGEPQFEGVAEVEKVKKELEIFTPKEIAEKKLDNSEKPLQPVGNYENVFISNQVPQIGMPPDSELYSTLSFPLSFRPSIEPPKEKPPPPPLELSDDEINKPELPPKPSLRRVDSTKRIKKEIRKKRSDFLGIEGSNEDNYLEPEIYVAPPPDMMTFLQEERRFEKQLYRQSICSESDSNHETAESRDSGVELDRGHVDDICWSKPDVLSEPHSRQNSETFGNTSVTSEEDEILKKEREIIEVLEKEEQWRYGNKNSHSAEESEIGEKLAVKLRQLEQEKMQLERERAEEEDRRKAEETARRQNEQRLIAKQQQLLEQENVTSNTETPFEQEALRFERERLQKEQEHLERCRKNLLKQQQNPEPVEIRHHESKSHWDTPSNRHSLQEVPIGVPMIDVPRHSMQDVSQPQYQAPMSSGYRYSLPDLQQREQRSNRPPPPVPPAKPIQRPMTQSQWEKETNIRNSRIPSADNIPLQIEASNKLRHGSSVPAINAYHGGQQMTRSTLHALSAVPRSRLISSEHWMQPKRKVDAPKTNYNYQHWLIQEAEHRRILEHQQKISHQHPNKRMLPYNGQTPANYGGSAPSHHTVGLPLSPQVQNQSNHKWISPPRSNKPLPDAVIQTLTQRVQNRENKVPPRKRVPELPETSLPNKVSPPETHPINQPINHSSGQSQERMLSVSGKKKCSHCNEELGRGAAMIIESLRLFYHIDCFKCCVCHVQLGDGLMGTDVRVRNNKLHCHNCYSSDDEKETLNEAVVEVAVMEEDAEPKSPATCPTPSSSSSSLSSYDRGGFESFYDTSVDHFPSETSNADVPQWFKTFYAAYQYNENRKYSLMQELSLRMIDFEIEKCELLIQIINKLQNLY